MSKGCVSDRDLLSTDEGVLEHTKVFKEYFIASKNWNFTGDTAPVKIVKRKAFEAVPYKIGISCGSNVPISVLEHTKVFKDYFIASRFWNFTGDAAPLKIVKKRKASDAAT